MRITPLILVAVAMYSVIVGLIVTALTPTPTPGVGKGPSLSYCPGNGQEDDYRGDYTHDHDGRPVYRCLPIGEH